MHEEAQLTTINHALCYERLTGQGYVCTEDLEVPLVGRDVDRNRGQEDGAQQDD